MNSWRKRCACFKNLNWFTHQNDTHSLLAIKSNRALYNYSGLCDAARYYRVEEPNSKSYFPSPATTEFTMFYIISSYL